MQNNRTIPNSLTFIQDVAVGENKGKLYFDKDKKEYLVLHDKEEPTMSEKLELLMHVSKITAEMQGVSHARQISASYIHL
ncbi:MAG: hypothetical protein AABY15_07085 [Nanoarchaeota archaeon]